MSVVLPMATISLASWCAEEREGRESENCWRYLWDNLVCACMFICVVCLCVFTQPAREWRRIVDWRSVPF